jgi:hypothetical protein
MIYVSCETKMGWTYAKKALGFAKLTNDGDDEGALFLDRLPTKSEAEANPLLLRHPEEGRAERGEPRPDTGAGQAGDRNAQSRVSNDKSTRIWPRTGSLQNLFQNVR